MPSVSRSIIIGSEKISIQISDISDGIAIGIAGRINTQFLLQDKLNNTKHKRKKLTFFILSSPIHVLTYFGFSSFLWKVPHVPRQLFPIIYSPCALSANLNLFLSNSQPNFIIFYLLSDLRTDALNRNFKTITNNSISVIF